MNNLLPQPHQTDEGAEGAGHNKAALQAVSQQVLSAEDGYSLIITSEISNHYNSPRNHIHS